MSEVAIQRTREALEGDSEAPVQALQHGHGQRHLRHVRVRPRPRSRARARPCRVPPQHAPHAREELLELFVVETTVSVEMFLWMYSYYNFFVVKVFFRFLSMKRKT